MTDESGQRKFTAAMASVRRTANLGIIEVVESLPFPVDDLPTPPLSLPPSVITLPDHVQSGSHAGPGRMWRPNRTSAWLQDCRDSELCSRSGSQQPAARIDPLPLMPCQTIRENYHSVRG